MKTIPKTGQTFYVNLRREDLLPEANLTFPHDTLEKAQVSAEGWVGDDEGREWVIIECKIVKRVKP